MSTIRAEKEDVERMRKYKHVLEATNDSELVRNVSLVLEEIGKKDLGKTFEKIQKKGFKNDRIITYNKDETEAELTV